MSADVIQGSPEWFAARLGKVSASRIIDVASKTKTGYTAGREDYKLDLAMERISGQKMDTFTNAYMEWGTQTEPEARAAYESMTGNLVQEVGFIAHPSIAMAGASPDGLVQEDGLLEIKAPSSKTHINYLITESIPKKYIYQMQWQMACTCRSWADFMSYDPRVVTGLQIFSKRVERDDTLILELEGEVIKFLNEVDVLEQKLRNHILERKAA